MNGVIGPHRSELRTSLGLAVMLLVALVHLVVCSIGGVSFYRSAQDVDAILLLAVIGELEQLEPVLVVTRVQRVSSPLVRTLGPLSLSLVVV